MYMYIRIYIYIHVYVYIYIYICPPQLCDHHQKPRQNRRDILLSKPARSPVQAGNTRHQQCS